MNRQRTLLLTALLALFFIVSAWIIYGEILSHRNTFTSGAPPQEIKDIILPAEIPTSALRPPALVPSDPMRFGDVSSSASVIEYGDYACESCKAMAPILDRVVASYKGNVRLVWHDLPITTAHPQALDAAIFARCAGVENKYWEAHDALIAAESLDEFSLSAIAAQLHLNMRTLASCRNDKTLQDNILHNVDISRGDGINTAPTIFVGTKAFVGAMTEEELRAAIDQFLKS